MEEQPHTPEATAVNGQGVPAEAEAPQEQPPVVYLNQEQPPAPETEINAYYPLQEPVDDLETLLDGSADVTDRSEVSQQETDEFYVREAFYTVEDAVDVQWNQYDNNRVMIQAMQQGVPTVLEPDTYSLELVYTPNESLATEEPETPRTLVQSFNDLIHQNVAEYTIDETDRNDPAFY